MNKRAAGAARPMRGAATPRAAAVLAALRARPEAYAAAAAALAGLASLAWYYGHGLTTAHYDAKAHLVVARRLTDADAPGYLQLGVHWLPLLHLLYAPLVLFDAQYRTALLPSLLSVCSFAVSAWLAARIARRITGSPDAALVAGVVLVANRNLRYLATAPLTEPLFVALMLGAIEALLGWRERADARWPWAGASLAALAAMCRYEGWYLMAAVAAVLAFDFARRPERRAASARALGLYLLLFGALAAAHFGYVYGAAGDSFLHRVARGHPDPSETYRRPFLAAGYHLGEIAQIAGIVPLAAAGVGAARVLGSRALAAPLVLLWIPSLTNVMALYWGMIYRVRWSALLLPAVAVSAGIAAADARTSKRALRAAALAAMALPWVSAAAPETWSHHFLRPGPGIRFVPASALVTSLAGEALAASPWPLAALLAAASERPALEGEDLPLLAETLEHRDLEPERRRVLAELARHYDGTRILVDVEKLAPLVYDAALPTRDFVQNEGDLRLWGRALEDPPSTVGWIVAMQGDAVWRALEVDPRKTRLYSLAVRTERFVLYRLGDADREILRRGGPRR